MSISGLLRLRLGRLGAAVSIASALATNDDT